MGRYQNDEGKLRRKHEVAHESAIERSKSFDDERPTLAPPPNSSAGSPQAKLATCSAAARYEDSRMTKRNEQTSSKVASLAGKVLSGKIKPTPTQVKKLAASVLTQSPDKKSGK